MEQNTTEAPKAPQGGEAETTETPERALLREVLAALDLPWYANYEDRDRRSQLLADRVSMILGYMVTDPGMPEFPAAIDQADMSPYVGHLSQMIARNAPVNYGVEGGESR